MFFRMVATKVALEHLELLALKFWINYWLQPNELSKKWTVSSTVCQTFKVRCVCGPGEFVSWLVSDSPHLLYNTEYYANTGALKKAAENRKPADPSTGSKKKVAISVIEAFGNTEEVPVKDVEDVLRLEYRSKLLNPKWRDAMLKQGSGGAYEISQRMTAMIGWSATTQVDNFVFDQAAERYALDEEVSKQLQRSNPEAFKNVVRRLLEAAGRGMWSTDEDILDKLREMYADADDLIEQGSDITATAK